MTTGVGRSSAWDDERAEGLPQIDEPQDTQSRTRAMTLPAVRLTHNAAPSGETGIIPAISVRAESIEKDDAQDASRTTAESGTTPHVQPQALHSVGHAPSVLIIEDAAELAELMQITLGRMKLDSIVESSGKSALTRFQLMKPDIVLLDIGLPDMSGWNVLDAIRETVGDPGAMPIVIVITAYGDATNRLVGKHQNVNSYLVKPFTSDELLWTVRQAISGAVG